MGAAAGHPRQQARRVRGHAPLDARRAPHPALLAALPHHQQHHRQVRGDRRHRRRRRARRPRRVLGPRARRGGGHAQGPRARSGEARREQPARVLRQAPRHRGGLDGDAERQARRGARGGVCKSYGLCWSTRGGPRPGALARTARAARAPRLRAAHGGVRERHRRRGPGPGGGRRSRVRRGVRGRRVQEPRGEGARRARRRRGFRLAGALVALFGAGKRRRHGAAAPVAAAPPGGRVPQAPEAGPRAPDRVRASAKRVAVAGLPGGVPVCRLRVCIRRESLRESLRQTGRVHTRGHAEAGGGDGGCGGRRGVRLRRRRAHGGRHRALAAGRARGGGGRHRARGAAETPARRRGFFS